MGLSSARPLTTLVYNEQTHVIGASCPGEDLAFMDFSSEEIVTIINSTRDGSIWDMLAITLASAEKDRDVATMPIGPQHRQQVGYLHAGVSVGLAESRAPPRPRLNSEARKPS